MVLDATALATLFGGARSHYHWADQPVSDDELRQVFALLRDGPTSANCSPARFMFLRTPEAQARLRPFLSQGNVESVMGAPVTCIVAHDPQFYEHLPRLWPHGDARSWYAGNAGLAADTAYRNGTLQGAYLIMACRAVGLDCGPMSGFDNARLDSEFMAATGWRSNFLVCIGHGDASKLQPRDPRFEFDEACRLL